MSKKSWLLVALVAVLALAQVQAASAAPLFSYAVKFVCGYNPTNVGISQSTGNREGEPTVKFGNYATDINVYNPDPFNKANIRKKVIPLVKEGFPVAREPRSIGPVAFDAITLGISEATMDDCNRIAELLYGGFVPTPLLNWIGFLVLESDVALDVTAVYTAEVCSYWVQSAGFPPPRTLDCLNPAGQFQGMSVSIDVEQVTGKQF